MGEGGPVGKDEAVLTPRFVLVVVSGLFYFSAYSALLPVVPSYVKHRLGGSTIEVGIAVGALAIGAVLTRPLAGRIGDRYGRKVLMVGGATIVAVTAGCSGLVHSLPWLIGTRLVMGLGEAAFFTGGTTMATDLAPVHRRGEAISYWSVAVWGGNALGPVIAVVVLAQSHYGRVWLMCAALAGTAALIALATKEAHIHRSAEPGRLIHPGAVRPGVLLACTVIGMVGFTTFLPLYAGEIGIHNVGFVFLVNGVVVLSIRVFGARLPDRLGPVRAGSIAAASTAAGLLTVALWHAALGAFVGAALLGVGAAFAYPAFLLLALRGVSDAQRGSLVGTFSAFFDLGNGVSGLMLGALAALTSYRGAFGGGALLALVALVLLRNGFAQAGNRSQ